MKSFKQWLLKQRKRVGAVGDLARDFRYDVTDTKRKPNEPALPGRVTTGTMRAYLENRRACDGALSALDAAIAEWESLRRQDRHEEQSSPGII
jgi:hypothetical protein